MTTKKNSAAEATVYLVPLRSVFARYYLSIEGDVVVGSTEDRDRNVYLQLKREDAVALKTFLRKHSVLSEDNTMDTPTEIRIDDTLFVFRTSDFGGVQKAIGAVLDFVANLGYEVSFTPATHIYKDTEIDPLLVGVDPRLDRVSNT